MKVLLFNGSPHKDGCVFTALNEIKKTLQEEGIESEIYHIGTKTISGCRACRACAKLGKCVIDDGVNEFLEYAKDFDGFILGSPVYYAAAAGGAGRGGRTGVRHYGRTRHRQNHDRAISALGV